MPKRIVILSEEVANQIAAGEVVERPASIVKELVENALDAGARDIQVELAGGGTRSIKVSDNGSGIERHATSKISKLDDIHTAGSFGFRGEAMASIASVAHVDLLTRRPEDLEGTKAVAWAGAIAEISPAGSPPGTQITVTELFANVPARRKFLKTESTEQSACLDAVTRLALANPEVRFSVAAEGRQVFAAPAAKEISERVAMVMGKDFTGHCLEIHTKKDDVQLQGYISTPQYTKSNSKSIFLFVNARFIRDNSLTHVVLAAYRQVIEPRRYPAAVLFIDLPGEDVDVNVHPAKLEVRFRSAREIYELVSRTVAENLAGARAAGESFSYRLTPRETTSAASGFWRPKPDAPFTADQPREIFSRSNMQRAINEDLFTRVGQPSDVPISVEESAGREDICFTNQKYLGQFAGTYLVFGGPDGLTLMDQHAAHERILLERLKAASETRAVSQPLLMPEVVSLTSAQVSLFTEALPLLSDIGLELEIFGRDAVVVKALPASLPQVTPADIISDLADQLGDQQALPSLTERKEKILASLACRAAVKANAPLSGEEVAALCRDLTNTPYSATCPHGRPVIVRIPLYEIERMFKRK